MLIPNALFAVCLVGFVVALSVAGLALVLFLMLSLQFPYVGDLGIRPTAMQDVLDLWKPRVGL